MPSPTWPSERRLYGCEEGMQPMYDGSARRTEVNLGQIRIDYTHSVMAAVHTLGVK